MAFCVIEWATASADAVIETHHRIVGLTWRDAKQLHDARVVETRCATTATLNGFTALGQSLPEAHGDGAPLEDAVARVAGRELSNSLVAQDQPLTTHLGDDAQTIVSPGCPPCRRYTPRMLRCISTKANATEQ